MADEAGKPVDDLSPDTTLPDADTNFFQLLRVLERGGGRFGRGADPGAEPARLGQRVRLSFAAVDIASVKPGNGEAPTRVDVQLLGLLGPEGPMPLHVTRWTLDRLSERWFTSGEAEADTTFADLCNMLQHRMITLFWRAWADTRPEVETERGRSGQVGAMLAALGGLGLPGTAVDPDLDPIKLRQAAGLALMPCGPERLTLFLADALGEHVELREFIGTLTEIPAALQSRLGKAHAGLGRDAVAGSRVFERRNRIEVRVGPLGFERFESLLPGTPGLDLLRRATVFAVGRELVVDLRLILARDAVPEPRLGEIALGRTFWLPVQGERGDADDFRVTHLVDADAVREMAA